MAQAAAVAKAAAGADKAYSRVAACCCCSIAVKTSAGIYAQIYAGGGGAGGGAGGGSGFNHTLVSSRWFWLGREIFIERGAQACGSYTGIRRQTR
jgi:hypothetical protein